MLVLLLVATALGTQAAAPHSVHVSVFNDPQDDTLLRYVIAWVTGADGASLVEFGPAAGRYTSTVRSTVPTNHYDRAGGYTHFAVLPANLTLGSVVYYRVGDGKSWSTERALRTKPRDLAGFRAWVAADFGIVNSGGVARAINSAQADLYLHAGDISYANDHPWEYETAWSKWWTLVEGAASSAPYMVSPGNHESFCRCIDAPLTRDFRVFKSKVRLTLLRPGLTDAFAVCHAGRCFLWWRAARLRVSDASRRVCRVSSDALMFSCSRALALCYSDNMWYSFDYGLAHIVSFSTESDYPGAPTDLKRRNVDYRACGCIRVWIRCVLSVLSCLRSRHCRSATGLASCRLAGCEPRTHAVGIRHGAPAHLRLAR